MSSISKATISVLLWLVFSNIAFAQNDTVQQNKKFFFTLAPVIGANPAFGFIYGVGGATSWYMGEPGTTKISSAGINISHTTKKQTIFTIKSTVFGKNNDMIYMGDWRYLNSSQATYGLGTGPQSAKLSNQDIEFDDGSISSGIDEEQMMSFQFFRFYETALKKLDIVEGLYAGVGIHLDLFSDIDDKMLDTEAENPVYTSYYYYNETYGFDPTKSTLIGLSANILYDTRDNINRPYNGRYAYAQFKYNPTWLGSDKKSTQLWLEYRDYFSLTEGHKNILGIWAIGNFTTSGTLPYMNLPAIGWDQYSKSGVPYSQGRFRGDNLVFAGMEFRKLIWGTEKRPNLLGGIVFVNGTTASGMDNGVKLFEYIEPGYGVGLRITVSEKARTNLGIDYGWGSYGTSGLFLKFNETF